MRFLANRATDSTRTTAVRYGVVWNGSYSGYRGTAQAGCVNNCEEDLGTIGGVQAANGIVGTVDRYKPAASSSFLVFECLKFVWILINLESKWGRCKLSFCNKSSSG